MDDTATIMNNINAEYSQNETGHCELFSSSSLSSSTIIRSNFEQCFMNRHLLFKCKRFKLMTLPLASAVLCV